MRTTIWGQTTIEWKYVLTRRAFRRSSTPRKRVHARCVGRAWPEYDFEDVREGDGSVRARVAR